MVLFIIGLDPLLELLADELTGQKIGNKEIKLLAYADDVSIIIKSNDEEKKALNIIESYCRYQSSAIINVNKSTYMPLGSKWKRDTNNITERSEVKYLGMLVNNNLNVMIKKIGIK